MKRHLQILLTGALALVAIQSSQASVTLIADNGSWTRLQWVTADSGIAWQGAQNSVRVAGDNDLFSFAVPTGSFGVVDVTDIRNNDDSYSVLDFNSGLTVLGSTTIGAGDDLQSAVEDPDVTFADASWGSGSINIIPNLGGNAVFQIVTDGVGAAGQGGVFVRVRTEVPEPSSSLLVLLGCAGLVARRRRA
jgi:hypothetical protein